MPGGGSCLKFRPRPQEYTQDFTNRKSVASKKKKKGKVNKQKLWRADKKKAVSVSGWSGWFCVDRGLIHVRKYEVSKKSGLVWTAHCGPECCW